MLGHKASGDVGVEESATRNSLWCQTLFERTPQWAAQPQTDWDTKPLLPAGEDRFGKQVTKGALENVLGLPPGQLELGRDTACQLDKGPIEERRPDFEAARHAGPVHRHQVLAGEIKLTVLIDQAIERSQFRLANGCRQLLVWLKVATGHTQALREEGRPL